jgi:hypothetical protein
VARRGSPGRGLIHPTRAHATRDARKRTTPLRRCRCPLASEPVNGIAPAATVCVMSACGEHGSLCEKVAGLKGEEIQPTVARGASRKVGPGKKNGANPRGRHRVQKRGQAAAARPQIILLAACPPACFSWLVVDRVLQVAPVRRLHQLVHLASAGEFLPPRSSLC